MIDNAIAWRESLLIQLAGARTHGRYSEALTIENTLEELDVLLAAITRAGTIN